MATMTFKANLRPGQSGLKLGDTGTNQQWSNIYATTVTLSQDPVSALEAATKQYVDNNTGSTSFIIPIGISGSASVITDNTITAQMIYDNCQNCVINSSSYGYIETTYSKTSSQVKIFGKAYYNIGAYQMAEFVIYEITATPSNNSITVEDNFGVVQIQVIIP